MEETGSRRSKSLEAEQPPRSLCRLAQRSYSCFKMLFSFFFLQRMNHHRADFIYKRRPAPRSFTVRKKRFLRAPECIHGDPVFVVGARLDGRRVRREVFLFSVLRRCVIAAKPARGGAGVEKLAGNSRPKKKKEAPGADLGALCPTFAARVSRSARCRAVIPGIGAVHGR